MSVKPWRRLVFILWL